VGAFELYTGKDQKWRWRLKASNGKIVASGQGYTTKDSALDGIDAVKREAASSDVTEVDVAGPF
jgi:uncharacterized protein YegP (UPF0339 family)